MIHALGVGRALEDVMYQAWHRGKDAADILEVIGKADAPYGSRSEVYYIIEVPHNAHVKKRYDLHIGMLADQGFPVETEARHKTLEWILQREPADSSRWLQRYVAQDYLLRIDNLDQPLDPQYKSVYCKYQAFMFGFYYPLLRQILSFELEGATAFFHGIWGAHSVTFLAMCARLGRCLRRDDRASRAHILYVFAVMYNGRRKFFDPTSSPP
jgi:hypothetical protein